MSFREDDFHEDKLMAPCEQAVRDIIPAIKAAIAVLLKEKHGYSITRIARILGVTPTAAQNYLNGKRGGAYLHLLLTIPELRGEVEEAAEAINLLRERGYSVRAASFLLCRLCRDIRYYVEKNKLDCGPVNTGTHSRSR
ncbi:hypothetical protein PYJP_17250 [Pyrofollis japonicus]|uniref:hypothetical protein n=1 Tax=Pyrofollis japonicus TaxID=3060460 RepID=UPI00295B7F3B|nr:hypothetical protein [Pyrofollis japonicus]BEP18373.1 hypothetical protein PYJP_17250 [Pyrofollis japonicus]